MFRINSRRTATLGQARMCFVCPMCVRILRSEIREATAVAVARGLAGN